MCKTKMLPLTEQTTFTQLNPPVSSSVFGMLDLQTRKPGKSSGEKKYNFYFINSSLFFCCSGWGGGPIPWHQYKEVNAWFDYVKVECNPIYNHVIPARSASKTSNAVSLNVNLDAVPPSNLNKKLSNGITVGQHASPGIPPTDKKIIIGKVPDAGYNHASPGAAPSQPDKKISTAA
jgi:hypothetical protein